MTTENNKKEPESSQAPQDSPPSKALLEDSMVPDRLLKLVKRAAKLKANGISERSICAICQFSDADWELVQSSKTFDTEYSRALARSEIRPAEVTYGINELEEQALKATMINIQSGICSPEFVLDALKYATKTRLEERKQEQERKASFTAATQIVINMNDLLHKALTVESQPASQRIIDFSNENRAIANGLDTETLVERAIGTSENTALQAPKARITSSPLEIKLSEEDLEDVLLVNSTEASNE